MVILHYIPSFKKSMGQTAQFAQMLKDVMGKTIETHIISGEVSRNEYVKRLGEVNPDVVHLHGCWNWRIAMAERWSIARGYPVILSPHDGLSPKKLQTDFWKKRIPQILAYQFRTIKNAYVLHASSAQELKDLKELGWKKRIALIPYPESAADHQVLRDSFHALYQKVIDTANRNRLHHRQREALWILLNAAVTARHEQPQPSATELQHLSEMSSHGWKEIMVYAIDHRIRDLALEGARALQFSIPVNVTEAPPRYTVKPAFHTGTETKREQKAGARYSAHACEMDMARKIYILFRQLFHNELRDGYGAPQEMLCRIAEDIRWNDYEEDILMNIVSDLKINDFTARLMQILSETMHLTIGYMPTDPIDDAKTETIRKKINNLI